MSSHPDLLAIYFADIASYEVPSPDEEAELFRRLRQSGGVSEQARSDLVARNQRLVVAIAAAYTGRGLELADLIQEGNLGLMTALERYDPHRGARFAVYASHWIRQSIVRALQYRGSTIRVPAHWQASARMLASALAQLESRTGAPAITDTDLLVVLQAAHPRVGWTPRRLNRLRYALRARSADSLHAPRAEGSGLALEQLLAAPQRSVEDAALDAALLDQIDAAIAALPHPSWKRVMRLRFGRETGEMATLEQIAAVLGVRRQRVHQIIRLAIAHIRQTMGVVVADDNAASPDAGTS